MRENEPSVFGLSAAFIQYLHDEPVLKIFPGSEPVFAGEVRDRNLLESAAAIPFQTAGGQEAYPSIMQKAAALFRSLIANHPFQNGNKRTAVLATDMFLAANDVGMLAQVGETYLLAKEVAGYRQKGISRRYFASYFGAVRGAF